MALRALCALVALLVAVAGAVPATAQVTPPRRDSVRIVPDTGGQVPSDPRPTVVRDTTEQGEILPDTVRIEGEPVEQAPGEEDEELKLEGGPVWRLSYFPYVTGNADGGPVIAARVRYWQPAEFADRVTSRGSVGVEGGAGFNGSRFVTARFEAPLLASNWRGVVQVTANRQVRFGFYGLGNETERIDSLENDAQPEFYDVRRTRYQALAEVTRRIAGPLHVALQGAVESARFARPDSASLFAQLIGDELEANDAQVRLALVLDTRDNEFAPSRGILAEFGGQLGSAGDGWRRAYGVVRGYLPLTDVTLLAARVGGGMLGGSPTLNARYEMPFWEDRGTVYGGYDSNRGLPRGRFVGEGVLFGNLEVRHELFGFKEAAFITVIGFVDVGRVFEAERFRLTLDGMHVGAGGGLGLRLLRNTVFTFNLARGSDGTRLSVGSGWAF
jgi:hypothetical protein